jgi:membrane-bound serine protease (ClpP class)
MRWRAICLGGFLLAAAAPPEQQQTRVLVMRLDGAIQPASQRYLARGLELAERSGAALVVVELDTPGGLLVSLREMTTAITSSKVPVAVLVAPPGARAASAGFFLLVAADVAAMAPGTNTGAAHPVTLGGQQQESDDTQAEKAAQDAAALIRALAHQRGRSVQWAELAVTESRSYTASEARDHGLVDLVAGDVDELLQRLDGDSIRRFDGRTQVLELGRGELERLQPTLAERLLMVIADPQIAYLLLMLGMLGLLIELTHPGAIVPGVVGGISLLLSLYALSVLPVNWAGALLIAVGIGLLVAEAFVTSYGAMALAGIASFVLGSMILVDVPAPGAGVGLPLIIPSAALMAGVTLLLLGRALRLRKAPAQTGLESMVGETGELVSAIDDGSDQGRVFVHGEVWAATAQRPLASGTKVVIEAIEGTKLRVVPAEQSLR